MSRVKSWLGSGGEHEVASRAAPGRSPSAISSGSSSDGDAAGEPRRELLGRHLAEPLAERLGEHHGDVLGPDPAGEQPLARLGVLEGLREQLVEQQHLDAALAHQVDERVVLLAGAPHPDHVVEQQLVAVRRREPLVGEVGPVHHHRAELPDLGVGSKRGFGGSAHSVSPFSRFSPTAAEMPMKAQQMTKTARAKGQTNFR